MFVHPWPKLDHFTIYVKARDLLIITNVTFVLLISEKKNWRTRSEINLLLDENLYVKCWKKDFIFAVIQDEQFFM
jgi:hypothetical protein